MKVWPLSEIAKLPLMCAAERVELMGVFRAKKVSENTMLAVEKGSHHVAPYNTTPAYVLSEGVSYRMAYLTPPSTKDWLRLERANFVNDGGTIGIVLEPLH